MFKNTCFPSFRFKRTGLPFHHKVRKYYREEIDKKLWGDNFRSSSYFIATTGDIVLEKVKEYIEGQRYGTIMLPSNDIIFILSRTEIESATEAVTE